MDFGLLQKSILSSLRDWGWGLRIYLLVPRQKIQTALNSGISLSRSKYTF